jgi:HlyD family secretion protein
MNPAQRHPIMQLKRSRWWIGGALVVAAAAWLIVSRRQPVEVDVVTVTSGPLRVTIDEAGTTRVRHHADVNAPTAGRWVPAALTAGDSVRAGALLGALCPAPMDGSAQAQARARVGAAEATLREADTRVTAARTALDEALRTRDRAQRMAAAGGLSDQELERARDAVTARQSEYDGARLHANGARYERESARAAADGGSGTHAALRIVAPLAGTLLRLFEEHERVVAPGTPLAQVGDARDLEVVIPLLTADAARVRTGAAVAVTVGSAGDTLRGRVTRVEPAAFTKMSALGVEEQRVNVIASIPATPVPVGDQFRVHARITVWESPRVLRVPAAALIRDGDQWFTFVVDGGRARRRAIGVGERGDVLVEARTGLAEGDRVIRYPADVITDGGRVRPR